MALFLLASLILISAPAAAAGGAEICALRLQGLDQRSAAPGEEVELRGRWGPRAEFKRPRLNRGDSHPLEVVDWREDVLRLRLPEGLPAGTYKIGVYCDHPVSGSRSSSGWLDFEVLGEAGVAARREQRLNRLIWGEGWEWVLVLVVVGAFLFQRGRSLSKPPAPPPAGG